MEAKCIIKSSEGEGAPIGRRFLAHATNMTFRVRVICRKYDGMKLVGQKEFEGLPL
jgi:hypothetical protein